MKLDKNAKLYTIKEISDMFNIPTSTLRVRCLNKGYLPRTFKGKHQYMLTDFEAKEILDKKHKKEAYPEIIYVTRTTEIYHSKLNFLTLEQL